MGTRDAANASRSSAVTRMKGRVGTERAAYLRQQFCSVLLYTVNHKKGGSTFVTITLENLNRFL